MKRSAIIVITACLVAPTASMAEVKSMSLGKFKDVDGRRYWEVAVTCKGEPNEKLIRRSIGQRTPWCSVDDASLCDRTKSNLSKKICTSNTIAEATPAAASTSPAEEIEPAEQSTALSATDEARKTELLREQVQIEEQRILIEQKRLELIQDELALKKQKK